MQLTPTTLLPLLLLLTTPLISASSFTLRLDKKWYGNGCSLVIENVCGCSKTVNINHAYECENLPDVYTHGNVCGGSWTLWTKQGQKHNVGFARGGCGRRCDLGELEDGRSCVV